MFKYLTIANMGQNCCSCSRVIAHSKIHHQLISSIKDHASELIRGDPQQNVTDFGPLIDLLTYRRVRSVIKKGLEDRIEIWQAGIEDEDHCILPPTIFMDVPDTNYLSREEIFGPVLSILKPYDDIAEAIERVNNSSFGLACGIFTESDEIAKEFGSKAETGMIWINTWNETPPHLPFGGFKGSGIGKELGLEGLKSYLKTKTLIRR